MKKTCNLKGMKTCANMGLKDLMPSETCADMGLGDSKNSADVKDCTLEVLASDRKNKSVQEIKISDFDYDLAQEKIAYKPLEKRSDSKLLIYENGEIQTSFFRKLIDFLPADSFLFFNNTRVVQARLKFTIRHSLSIPAEDSPTVEIFCLEPLSPRDIAEAYSAKNTCTFLCIVGNNRKWKTGNLKLHFDTFTLEAERIRPIEDAWEVKFSWDAPTLCFAEVLEKVGLVPLPPYIKRNVCPEDKNRYQAVFAHYNGSVAAPTASLHFTPELIGSLKNKDINFDYLTLHVGAGTFKPVKSEEIGGHFMHAERLIVRRENLINLTNALAKGKTIIPVGTTSARSLESLYWFGVKLLSENITETPELLVEQWDPYIKFAQSNIDAHTAIVAVLNFLDKYKLDTLQSSTSLMIVPSYSFRICSGIITNFHQPKSTLLLLIAAMVGEDWKNIYKYALAADFRFLSFGDSCLLWRQGFTNK